MNYPSGIIAGAARSIVGSTHGKAGPPAQKQTGFEHASSIFTVGPGYSYTDPVTQGQKTTVDPNNTTGVPKAKAVDLSKSPIPSGTQLVGEAHSHPGNSGLSGNDIQRTHDLTILGYGHPLVQGGYVGLPNNSVIKYDPHTGAQTIFRPGEP